MAEPGKDPAPPEDAAARPNGVEAALRDSEERFRWLFETLDGSFALGEVVRDVEGRVTDFRFLAINSAAERSLGLSRGEVVGKTRSELLPAEPALMKIYAEVVNTGRTIRTERHSPLLDRWVSLVVFPQGQDRFAALSQDITDQKRAAMQRASARIALHKSEERMRLAIRATRMVTWEWLPESDSITTSTNFGELYGLPELAGAAAGFALVLPEDREPHLAKVRRIAVTGGTYDSEFRIRRPVDGRVVWLEERAEAHMNERGRVERVIGVTLDITERKRTERALRDNEELQSFLLRLSDALRSLSDSIEVKDVATRMVGEYFGCAWAYCGEGDEPLTQMRVKRCYTRGSVPSLVGLYPIASLSFREELQAGRPVAVADLENEPKVAAGTRASFGSVGMRSFAAAPIIKNGNLRAVLVVADTQPRTWSERELRLLREVVERTWAAIDRARADAALRASEASLKLADRVKDEFLAVLGHELRTPLAAITLWAGLLRSSRDLSAEGARAVDAILQSADAQTRVVDDLLDLSRLMTGKLLLAPRSVDVEQVAQGIIDVLRPTALAKGLQLSFDAEPGVVRAFLDPARLRQVLSNLLSNAIQFTSAGGHVALRLGASDVELVLDVTDTGEGIAPEALEHLFQRFWQADMRETRRHGGLGIGLALSRQLIELQGGSISAHSEGLGHGAAFRVRLPRGSLAERQELGETSDFSAHHVALQGASVLLVEGDESTLAAMESTLVRAGATVHALRSGAAALELIERGHVGVEPLVLVSDFGREEVVGVDLVERLAVLRRNAGRPPMTACAVSAHTADATRHRAIEAGFDIFVRKPITPERLVEVVSDLVQIAAEISGAETGAE